MNVTGMEAKYSQIRLDECFLQKGSAEHERYAEAYDSKQITENNSTNTTDQRLLEQILERNNLNQAFLRVKANKGAYGIDKMEVGEMLKYLKNHGETIKQAIAGGKYKPNPVRRVEIPKDGGGKRPLGIPTVIDRLIQQAVAQVLSPIFEQQFSNNSHGFRPNRGCHGAIKQCQEYINHLQFGK